jgi:hypothetical protein
MAKSLQKTTLAILRHTLGVHGHESRFARRIRRSPSWVKQASSGHLPLTRSVAIVVAYETGVSFEWLMTGDPTQPPVDMQGMPYTLETFARHIDTIPGNNQNERFQKAYAQLLADYAVTRESALFVLNFETFASEMRQKFKK